MSDYGRQMVADTTCVFKRCKIKVLCSISTSIIEVNFYPVSVQFYEQKAILQTLTNLSFFHPPTSILRHFFSDPDNQSAFIPRQN